MTTSRTPEVIEEILEILSRRKDNYNSKDLEEIIQIQKC